MVLQNRPSAIARAVPSNRIAANRLSPGMLRGKEPRISLWATTTRYRQRPLSQYFGNSTIPNTHRVSMATPAGCSLVGSQRTPEKP